MNALAVFYLAALSATTATCGVIKEQVEDFFDSFLEEAGHLISANRQVSNSAEYGLHPFLDMSLRIGKAYSRGPTKLERYGEVEGTRAPNHSTATAIVSLGQLDYSMEGIELDLFGASYRTSGLQLTLSDAKSVVSVSVYRDGLSSCQVSVEVGRPFGTRLVHFGSSGGPVRLLVASLEYMASIALGYVQLPFLQDYSFFPDVTSRIESQLTIGARRISC